MILLVIVDFCLIALNVYYGLSGNGNTALNWAAAVFLFGISLVHFAMYIKEDKE